MGIYKMGDAFSPSPDALSRVGLSQRERRRTNPSPTGRGAGAGLAQKFNCTQCHGPRLLGQQQIPRLAGQQFEYLRSQLRAFKAGKRGELDGNMTAAAQALTDQDIEVLADYIAGLGS